MIINNRYFENAGRITAPNVSAVKPSTEAAGKDFKSMLQEQIGKNEEIKFSKHAESRLKERNIELTEMQKAKMSQAIEKASGKGVKDTLIIMDNLAFVVNVKSRTVITAVNNNDLKNNIFTNIDGAVFA